MQKLAFYYNHGLLVNFIDFQSLSKGLHEWFGIGWVLKIVEVQFLMVHHVLAPLEQTLEGLLEQQEQNYDAIDGHQDLLGDVGRWLELEQFLQHGGLVFGIQLPSEQSLAPSLLPAFLLLLNGLTIPIIDKRVP